MSGTAFSRAAAVLHRDRNLSVPATYTPAGGGAPVQLRVVLGQPTDVVAGLGGGAATAGQAYASILQADVPERPGRNATLIVDGKTYTVAAPAQSDPRRLAWKVVLGG